MHSCFHNMHVHHYKLLISTGIDITNISVSDLRYLTISAIHLGLHSATFSD